MDSWKWNFRYDFYILVDVWVFSNENYIKKRSKGKTKYRPRLPREQISKTVPQMTYNILKDKTFWKGLIKKTTFPYRNIKLFTDQWKYKKRLFCVKSWRELEQELWKYDACTLKKFIARFLQNFGTCRHIINFLTKSGIICQF